MLSTSLMFCTAALDAEYAPCQGVGLKRRVKSVFHAQSILNLRFPADRSVIDDQPASSFRHDRNDGLAHTDDREGIGVEDLLDRVERLVDERS